MNIEQFFADNPDWRPFADIVVLPPDKKELKSLYPDISREALDRSDELVSEGGGHVSRGALYIRIRRELKREASGKGRSCGDRWAAMLCLQQPPGINTTDTFWSGRKPWHEVFGPEYADKIKKKLAAKGVNLLPGDEYMPELARHPGDVEAVVPFSNARGYMKKLCESRGWAAEGAVECKHRQPEQDPHTTGPKMAEDLIRQKARLLVQENPSLKKIHKSELRARVLAKFGPSS